MQNELQEFFNHDLNEEFLQEHNQRAVQLGNHVPVARTNNILTNGNRQLIVDALRNGTATIASLSATFQVDKRTIRRCWKLGPIENLFSQWKSYVKEAQPQNLQEIYNAMNSIREKVTAEQLNNYVIKANVNCQEYLRGIRRFEN